MAERVAAAETPRRGGPGHGCPWEDTQAEGRVGAKAQRQDGACRWEEQQRHLRGWSSCAVGHRVGKEACLGGKDS